jgi:hypothetical protein
MMSRKPNQRSTLEWKLAEIAQPKAPRPLLVLSRAIVRSSAGQRRADEIGDAAKQHPLAQIYRVEISNFRHNRMLPLQHNGAQFCSSCSAPL